MVRIKTAILISLSFGLALVIWGCSGGGGSSASGGSATSCTVTDDTTGSGSVSTNGCSLLVRDTSSCQASRTAQGLSGFWLKFSCRVTLVKSGDQVTLISDGQPDYKSPYFGSSSACYEALSVSGRAVNPNALSTQSISMTVDYTPAANGAKPIMAGGAVGMTLNGVAIYDNEAAPGDNIYDEVDTFDKCEGHPDNRGMYHYHTEPLSMTDADDNFIGIMRDGFPIYGSAEFGGGAPAGLDADTQAHNDETTDSSGANVIHYHVDLQTVGPDSAYFITNGQYHGTAGTCTGC